jgi:hypothetical protein
MTREEYMDANSTASDTFKLHHDYYAQFVTPAIMTHVVQRIGRDWIKRALATDPHMNSIPLGLWDAMHQWIPSMTRDKRKELGEGNSISTSVCIAKAAARMWANEEPLREIVRNYHRDDD